MALSTLLLILVLVTPTVDSWCPLVLHRRRSSRIVPVSTTSISPWSTLHRSACPVGVVVAAAATTSTNAQAATDSGDSDNNNSDNKCRLRNERDDLLRRFLLVARELGPVGSYHPNERQDELLALAKQLQKYSEPEPARIPLEGTHSLIYSASKGFSSGKLYGSIFGQVTQEFVSPTLFRNKVQLGPLQLALTASREIKSDTAIRVTFERTALLLLNNVLVEKEIKGEGIWKYIFAGVVREEEEQEVNGQTERRRLNKLIRVFEAPNLFVLEQVLD